MFLHFLGVFDVPRVVRFVSTLFVGLAALGGSARADGDAPREQVIGVGLGYGHLVTLDEAASRLVYGANTGVAALEYIGEAGAVGWGLRTFVGYGPERALAFDGRTVRFRTVEPDGSTSDVTVPMRGTRLSGAAEARVGYVHRLGRIDLLVGASVEYALTRSEGFIMPGLMQRVVAGPSVGLRFRIGERQQIELEARTSLGGWSSRLPYHQSVSMPGGTPYQGFVRQGSSRRSLVTQRTLELAASHRLRLREHLALRSALYVSYLNDDDPRALRALSTRFLLVLDTVF